MEYQEPKHQILHIPTRAVVMVFILSEGWRMVGLRTVLPTENTQLIFSITMYFSKVEAEYLIAS